MEIWKSEENGGEDPEWRMSEKNRAETVCAKRWQMKKKVRRKKCVNVGSGTKRMEDGL